MAQQTAVEWLECELKKIPYINPIEAFRQAKQMEFEQMKGMYEHGSLSLLDTGHGDTFEQYYNETYGK